MSLVTVIANEVLSKVLSSRGSSNSSKPSNLLWMGLLAGVGVGIAGALLCTPTGKQARVRLTEKAKAGAQGLREQADNLKQQAIDALDEGAGLVDRAKQEVTVAIDAGKQAFEEARIPKVAKA